MWHLDTPNTLPALLTMMGQEMWDTALGWGNLLPFSPTALPKHMPAATFCPLSVVGIASCKGKIHWTELIFALKIRCGWWGTILADPNMACLVQRRLLAMLCVLPWRGGPTLWFFLLLFFIFYQTEEDIFYYNGFKSNVYRPTQIGYYKLKNCTSGTILLELVFTSNNTS